MLQWQFARPSWTETPKNQRPRRITPSELAVEREPPVHRALDALAQIEEDLDDFAGWQRDRRNAHEIGRSRHRPFGVVPNRGSETEICPSDVLVCFDGCGRAGQHDMPKLNDIGLRGKVERKVGILLD